jgi:hypothetical protein
MRIFVLLLTGLLFTAFVSAASNDTVRSYRPARVTAAPPVADGMIQESEWPADGWESAFIQQKPLEFQPGSQRTDFKILYDNNFIYIAYKVFETDPSKVSRRLSRRDEMEGDLIGIQLDSYFDKTTAFLFWITAAGVKIDGIVGNGIQGEDVSWDAVWIGKTAETAEGWTAEMKIPLSQLRFSAADSHTWGMQILRYIERNDEVDLWQPIAVNAPTWVSRFGLMNGLEGIQPKRQIELMPYLTAQTERYRKDEGDPFHSGKSSGFSGGLDGKIGISNNMILDFTINPDFGQVEADPSEVNLSAFESYFEEKRPFFVEGNNILSFGVTPGDNESSSDNLFYSRRIGRAPHRDLSDYDFYDSPANTTILGAFKLTGKTRNGWSVGVLESVASREKADVVLSDEQNKLEVEPLTNYFISRVKKDFNKGITTLGGMFTAVNRNLENTGMDDLHKAAYTGGIDFSQSWKDRTYYLNVKLMGSYVSGDTSAIKATQESSARYFQRPDATYLNFDPTRTSLAGHAGIVEFGKAGNGKWLFDTWINWRSPGFEINDAGFQRRSDDIFQVIWIGYRQHNPVWIFKRISYNFNQWTGWDFGQHLRYSGTNVNANFQFVNQWNAGMGVNRDFAQRSNYVLRGGPAMLLPGGNNLWVSLSTNRSRKINGGANFNVFEGDDGISLYKNFSLRLTYTPVNAVNISFTPFYSKEHTMLQYVENTDMQGNDRYVFASMHQETLGLPFRINVGITPDMTIQYYGQPFIAAGEYFDYKMITDPKADAFTGRFRNFEQSQISYDSESETFSIDEDNNGSGDYSFSKPDFNAFHFISNLVLRWEYRPGSSVYLVWSQNRSDSRALGRFNPGSDFDYLSTIFPHNVFLIKISYRLSV